ncbi:cell division protein FtsZ homolog 2-2, chloroplastic-like [Hibiscus syriacus]|uniref:cell division protein FtsZ homolog 2-2, chloroplastic-like n=1 Tax=Hibiscus syriacus TaxID=106335 RepID=UPI001920DBE4|nr:cell division protein FtsZ homolog 2-2, chloroplastic-like [Hibiscus syriacus]
MDEIIPGLVNVDFADVRTIMANAGSSLMGIGTATGKTRARDAALNAIQSPSLDLGIERATGIVWIITGGSDLTLFEVSLHLLTLSVCVFCRGFRGEEFDFIYIISNLGSKLLVICKWSPSRWEKSY